MTIASHELQQDQKTKAGQEMLEVGEKVAARWREFQNIENAFNVLPECCSLKLLLAIVLLFLCTFSFLNVSLNQRVLVVG